jgi:hypothetical protein
MREVQASIPRSTRWPAQASLVGAISDLRQHLEVQCRNIRFWPRLCENSLPDII